MKVAAPAVEVSSVAPLPAGRWTRLQVSDRVPAATPQALASAAVVVRSTEPPTWSGELVFAGPPGCGSVMETVTLLSDGAGIAHTSTVTIATATSETRPVTSVTTTPISYWPALSAVNSGFLMTELEKDAVAPSGLARTDH